MSKDTGAKKGGQLAPCRGGPYLPIYRVCVCIPTREVGPLWGGGKGLPVVKGQGVHPRCGATGTSPGSC